MSEYYILLHGARKNMGDFLIKQRTTALLNKYRPDRKLRPIHFSEPLDDRLDEVNGAKAILIHGGPAIVPKLYPELYRLSENLDDIKVPIIPMAVGWHGIPGDERSEREYKFSQPTMALLKKIHEHCEYSSCRDTQTVRVLNQAGFSNALMTGCSVWYDLAKLEEPLRQVDALERIAFSTPVRPPAIRHSAALLEGLRARFPDATIDVMLNHGWDHPASPYIKASLDRFGLEYRDLAGKADKAEQLSEYDLQVGYRLHSHLYCLSQNVPSVLLCEDGRGTGAQEALGLPIFPVLGRRLLWFADGSLPARAMTKIFGISPFRTDWSTVDAALQFIEDEFMNEWAQLKAAKDTIRKTFAVMEQFLNSLP